MQVVILSITSFGRILLEKRAYRAAIYSGNCISGINHLGFVKLFSSLLTLGSNYPMIQAVQNLLQVVLLLDGLCRSRCRIRRNKVGNIHDLRIHQHDVLHTGEPIYEFTILKGTEP